MVVKNIIKFVLVAFALFVLIFAAEAVYVLNHRDVLSSYLLRTAQFISSKGNTRLALFILTEGRVKIQNDDNLETQINNYLSSFPNNYDLARVDYELAILASKSNSSDLIPRLLEVSIERDPDFSFWYVELANFYLSINKTSDADKVLDECMALPAPRQHCTDYKNSDFKTNIIHPLGFLSESIDIFYQ